MVENYEGVSTDSTRLVSVSQDVELLKRRAQELSRQNELLEWKPVASEWDRSVFKQIEVQDVQQAVFGSYRNITVFVIRPAEDGLVLE